MMTLIPHLLLAMAVAASDLTMTVAPLSALPFVAQHAEVTVANPGAEAVSVVVGLRITPPVETVWGVERGLQVPGGGQVTVVLPYELYAAGVHAVAISARVATEVVAEWTGELTVAALDAWPLVLPNYYRQNLMVVRPGATAGEAPSQLLAEGLGDPIWEVSPGLAAAAPQVLPGPGARRLPGPVPGVTLETEVLRRPRGAEVVSVGADNRLFHQGEPWFPLGLYEAPTTPKMMALLAGAGFDLVQCPPLPPAMMGPALDALEAHGLRAWSPIGSLLDMTLPDEAAQQRLSDLVAAVGDHPALALWEAPDEPAWNSNNAEGLWQGYRFLRALDPRRPIWTNHAPRNSVPHLAWYNRATDVTGADIYPVPAPQTQSSLADPSLAVVGAETRKQRAAVYDQKPILMVLQAFAWSRLADAASLGVFPTFAESRFMAYEAVVNGANGLLWWGIHSTPRPSAFWSELQSLVSELARLQAPLAAPNAPARLQPAVEGDGVRALRRAWEDRSVVFVVNETDEPRAAVLRFPDTADATAARWRALFADDPQPTQVGAEVRLALPAWGVAVLSTHPTFTASRRDFSEPRAVGPEPLVVEPGNLVVNAGFEQADALTGAAREWTPRYPHLTHLDVGAGRGGGAALRIEDDDTGFIPLAVNYSPTLTEPGLYRLIGWVRVDGADPDLQARIYVEWERNKRYGGLIAPWTTVGAEWQELSIERRVTTEDLGTAYAVVQVNGRGQVWFDDLRFERLGD